MSFIKTLIMNMKTSAKIIAMLVMFHYTNQVFAQNTSDTSTILNIIQEETFSWNKGDAETYSRHFAEDGTFTNILGMFSVGHKIFLEKHDQIFKTVFLVKNRKPPGRWRKQCDSSTATLRRKGKVS